MNFLENHLQIFVVLITLSSTFTDFSQATPVTKEGFQYQSLEQNVSLDRVKREESTESGMSETPVTEALMEDDDDVKKGPGLGFIIGVATLICFIIYIIGITYKLIKIHKGTYVEEEPIFLKYK
ncbi:uncharacterized protein LOC111702999 [Eurytemora carolleeae]|uniref:uncharacterized protein LOC111702999 n=1 Tax=Eurytemora carolleeae TaxID=1294199 RepID=UPI000C7783D1|nr:uncharacterized protein LOC111702999 [Eurytemora carolleeae]|eukprot:XP_023330603.1 uncharacterized protein LOC111702999 [Eurytemora affinis]